MFDLYSLRQSKRETLEVFGNDDRSKWVYRADLTNKYTRPDAGKYFQDFFEKEAFGLDFTEQNSAFIDIGLIPDGIKILKLLYANVYGITDRVPSDTFFRNLTVDCLVQARLIYNRANKNDTIYEFGPGLGLTTIFFIHFYAKDRRLSIFLVEAVEPLLCLQQRLLAAYLAMFNVADYCVLDGSNNFIEPINGIVVYHVAAWNIRYLPVRTGLIFGARFLDVISERDYDVYMSFFLDCYRLGSQVCFWGGIERGGGGDPLFLFNFGKFIDRNILNDLDSNFSGELVSHGSEFMYATTSPINELSDSRNRLLSLEHGLLKKVMFYKPSIMIDDNSNFVKQFRNLEELNQAGVAYSSSASTAPLPLDFERRSLKDLPSDKPVLILSYRWSGHIHRLRESYNLGEINKLSERIIFVEIMR